MRKMNRILMIVALFGLSAISFACSSNAEEGKNDKLSTEVGTTNEGKVVMISEAQFKQLIWDYSTNAQAWKFEGELPAVVDFYADWCGPCKLVAPIMDKLAKEFKGKINIYKVNVDKNKELSGVFGINSIPAILFIPKDGKPAMQPGLMKEEQYRQIFKEFVLGIKQDTEQSKKENK